VKFQKLDMVNLNTSEWAWSGAAAVENFVTRMLRVFSCHIWFSWKMYVCAQKSAVLLEK